jgi:hypothetical protein
LSLHSPWSCSYTPIENCRVFRESISDVIIFVLIVNWVLTYVPENSLLQEVGGGRGDWMESAQVRDRWRALMGTVRNFWVP